MEDFPPGRGGKYKVEEGSVCGSYEGKRGYGHGDSSRNDFGHRGKSRGFQNRGNKGYQKSNQAGNTTERVNRGVGPDVGSARGRMLGLQGAGCR